MHRRETLEFLENFLGDLHDPGLDEDTTDRIVQNLSSHLPEIVDQAASLLTGSLHRSSGKMLRRRRRDMRGFRHRHRRIWRHALDALETCVVLATESGEIFISKTKATSDGAGDHRLHALTRLHARSCLVATEVLEMLRGGFAEGANARWRTLHEISVTSLFLLEHGNEIAEKYLDFIAVQEYANAILLHQREDLPASAVHSEEDLRLIADERQRVIEKHGAEFSRPYGWAATALDDPRPSFAKIEASIGLSHLRSFFRMASQSVHSGPDSLESLLANPMSRVLLVGPSNFGLAIPGQSTAIAVHQVTGALLLTQCGFQELVTLQVLNTFVEEAITCFGRLDRDEARAEDA